MANDNRNLGIPNTSRSSALGTTSQGPDLESLLQGTTFGQTLSQAQTAGQRAQDIQGQEEPSLLQRLLSPGGLASLAGLIASGVGGGGAGALAFGAGALPQIGAQLAEEKEDRAAAVQALQAERDEALDRAEKSMNRFTSILNANPEALGDIPPSLLGPLATGEAIRITATARRRLARVDEGQKRRHTMLMEVLGTVESIEDARTIIRQIYLNQDWKAPTEVIDALAKSMGTGELESTAANIYAEHGGSSFRSAVIEARERGVNPFTDPEILSMIDWNETEEDSLSPSQREDLKVLQLDEEINEWTSDPDNKTKLAEFRAETGEDEIAFQRAVIEEVFAGRGGDINLYLDARGHLARDGKWKAFAAAWNEAGGPWELAEAILSTDPKYRQANDEQRLRLKAHAAFTTFKAMLDSVNETQAFDDATSLHTATQRFLAEIPNMDSELAQKIARTAITNATDQTGRVDKEKFEQEVQTAIDQFLDQRKSE